MKKTISYLVFPFVLGLCFSAQTLAEEMGTYDKIKTGASETTEEMSKATDDKPQEMKNAKQTVEEAAEVVQEIKADPESRKLLEKADAAFIVPDYGRAALGVGGAGGQGVLVSRTEDGWSGPAFYNIGAINVGITAGVEAGSIAFLIMSDEALDGFKDKNNFSLNADAGLTIIDYSKRGQASLGKGTDVVVWSDTEGLFGDLAISVSDIFWDEEANALYYDESASPSDIIQGNLQASGESNPLRSEFSALEATDKQMSEEQEMAPGQDD